MLKLKWWVGTNKRKLAEDNWITLNTIIFYCIINQRSSVKVLLYKEMVKNDEKNKK